MIARLTRSLPDQGQHPTEAVNDWQWPVDLGSSERRRTFSEQDVLELEFLMTRQQLPPTLPASWEQLMQPIYAVLNLCTSSQEIHQHARRLLMVEMQHRRAPFWSWTRDEWSEMLCGSAMAFEQRYPGAPDCRQLILAVAYLLCDFTDFHTLGEFSRKSLADAIFGPVRMEAVLQRVSEGARQWGLQQRADAGLNSVVREVLLLNRSPRLEDLTVDFLHQLHERASTRSFKRALVTLSHALMGLGLQKCALSGRFTSGQKKQQRSKLLSEGTATVAAEWLHPCQRWYDTSTLTRNTRYKYYGFLLKVGRWLTQDHPDRVRLEAWTREFAATCVAFVDQLRIGEWIEPGQVRKIPDAQRVGQPIGAQAKAHLIAALRTFFLDCQEWEWIPRRFDPRRCLALPRSIKALIGPDPRVIQTDLWAKLLWAGLNLTTNDLASWSNPRYMDQEKRYVVYPLEMVRAMAIVWLFCGLRSDEWSRLRVGCVRWQREGGVVVGPAPDVPKDATCLLDVPTHKTGTAFTKPVDWVVGEAITQWEHHRPPQSPRVDPKTGEEVHFLFSYRDKHPQKQHINTVLIPVLCKKGGVPRKDARGNITSHRARSTIASQLFNAKEPLSLFELQEWLGHRYLSSTQHYAAVTPNRLAQSKAKAEYFERNLRLIEVLIDQEAVKSGAAAQGTPWRYYDLGHGLCTYDFFEQCPHRMACAKCAFYVPKGSSLEQVLEGKANLLRLKQEIPLTEEEVAAVDDGLAALEKLHEKLLDVPTPAGPTPRQLEAGGQEGKPFIAVETIQRRSSRKHVE